MTSVDQALLQSEWAATYGDGEDRGNDAGCPCCREWLCTGARHAAGCPMDAALCERGYPDQSARDRARERLRAQALAPSAPRARSCGLPRGPDGRIDDCAIANGDEERDCRVCPGACPDKAAP